MKSTNRLNPRDCGLRLAAGVVAVLSSMVVYGVGIFADPILNPIYLCAVGLTVVHVLAGGRRSITAKLLLALVSGSLTLAGMDLLLRPLLAGRFYYRPHDRLIRSHPEVRPLTRYRAGAHFEGRAYGDLAAMTGEEQYRDYRQVRFQVDERGYRNDPADVGQVYDTLTVGDSYGVGVGTTQEHTWSAVLTSRYGRAVYNLSIPGGPWDLLMHVSLELPRLPMKPGAWIIWLFFAGNDRDAPFLPILDAHELAHVEPRQLLRERLQDFRDESPVQRMWENIVRPPHRGFAERRVIVRQFLDGRPLLFARSYYQEAKAARSELQDPEHWRVIETVFAAAKQLATAHDCRLGLVFVPSKADVYSWVIEWAPPWSTPATPSDLGELLQGMAERNGIPFLNVRPLLVVESRKRFEASGDILWWYDDTHFNPVGNALLAEAVFREFLAPNPTNTSGSRATLTSNAVAAGNQQ